MECTAQFIGFTTAIDVLLRQVPPQPAPHAQSPAASTVSIAASTSATATTVGASCRLVGLSFPDLHTARSGGAQRSAAAGPQTRFKFHPYSEFRSSVVCPTAGHSTVDARARVCASASPDALRSDPESNPVKMSMTRPRTGQKIIRSKCFVGHWWTIVSYCNAKFLLNAVGRSDVTPVQNCTCIPVAWGLNRRYRDIPRILRGGDRGRRR